MFLITVAIALLTAPSIAATKWGNHNININNHPISIQRDAVHQHRQRPAETTSIVAADEGVQSNEISGVAQSETESFGNHNSEKGRGKGHLKTLIGLRLAEVVMGRLLSMFISDPDVLKVVSAGSGAVLWIVCLLSSLGRLGIDTKPILSVFSILGLTFGLAAKDILKDTFAGLFVVFMKPFKRGWVIQVLTHRGKVLSIDGRYVRLLNTKEKGEILLPLSLVYEHTIFIIEKNNE